MPLSAIGMTQGVLGTTGATGLGGVTGTQGTQATDGTGFATALTGAVDNLQQLSGVSKDLLIKAVTGDLAAIRNKGIDAFNEIMRMQA